ncbi:MAG: putative ATP-binding protein involved in virulence [Flammeovirgaceae bacterium]|jgi:predicted ATP-binding protein involved in virulence
MFESENLGIERACYLEKINLENFYAIGKIELSNLAHCREIYFLGENGDGKTLLLQAIVLAIKYNEMMATASKESIAKLMDLKEYSEKKAQKNQLRPICEAVLQQPEGVDIAISAFQQNHGIPLAIKYLYAYGINRHQTNSERKKEPHGFLTLFDDYQNLEHPARWISTLYAEELEAFKNEKQKIGISLNDAKKLLKDLLDKNVTIKENIHFEDVQFIERGTAVAFDNLSKGYKSTMTWVSDLVIRMSRNQPNVRQLADFVGVVLVDEIGLHLHPKWKFKLVGMLRNRFPKVQFIFTTHSPTVVMGASKKAIFYKLYKEDGLTKISDPISNKDGFVANELLTSSLFELDSFTSKRFPKRHMSRISSDDYIYQKIHEAISARIEATPNSLDDDQIMSWVEEELSMLDNITRE